MDPYMITENLYDMLLLVKGNMLKYYPTEKVAVVAFEAIKFCVPSLM